MGYIAPRTHALQLPQFVATYWVDAWGTKYLLIEENLPGFERRRVIKEQLPEKITYRALADRIAELGFSVGPWQQGHRRLRAALERICTDAEETAVPAADAEETEATAEDTTPDAKPAAEKAEAEAAAKAQPAPRTKAERRTNRRQLQATLRQRTRSNRAAAHIRRTGTGTLASHCIAAGLAPKEARTVAGSLRKNAAKAGVTGTTGTSYTKGRARVCTRYTPAEVAAIAVVYRPRKAAYKAAAAKLALAA